MTSYVNKAEFGDIVLLEFPFTDGQQSKKRPALVLLDTQDGDMIVCRITSKLHQCANAKNTSQIITSTGSKKGIE